jgi:hypothetical protein
MFDCFGSFLDYLELAYNLLLLPLKDTIPLINFIIKKHSYTIANSLTISYF